MLRDLATHIPAPLPSLPLLCCAALLGWALMVAPSVARAAARSTDTHLVATAGAWRVVTRGAASRLVCYAYASPLSSTPRLPGRGRVVLTVTRRAGVPRDAVALSAGFPFRDGADVAVTAGADRLRFYTAGRSAFARSDAGAIAAFAAAAEATARSPAPGGRIVTDVFSLAGFAAARAALARACPRHA